MRTADLELSRVDSKLFTDADSQRVRQRVNLAQGKFADVLAALGDGPLVAHNAAFDIVLFAPWMREPLTLCTLKAARVIYPEADNHKLTTLKYYLGLEGCHDRAHSADEDVNVLMQLVKRMCQDAECGLPELMHIQNIPRKIHKMSFGKHRGKDLSEHPKDYVNWLLTKADNIDSDLRASLLAL